MHYPNSPEDGGGPSAKKKRGERGIMFTRPPAAPATREDKGSGPPERVQSPGCREKPTPEKEEEVERFLLPSVDSRAHPSVRSLFHPKDDYGLSREKLFSPSSKEGGGKNVAVFFLSSLLPRVSLHRLPFHSLSSLSSTS